MAHRRQGPVAFEVAVARRAVSGVARPAESRALPAKGSLGTLCPRLPGLLTARISSGLAGEELHGRDKEVRGVGWRDPEPGLARAAAAGGIGARVSPPRRDDPIAALNQVLSEVIDAILDVRQAHRRVPETHALNAVLDQLFADLRTWAGLLADQDQALGVSPLAYMPSAAGRTPPTRWHGAASDEEVRRIVGEHLDRLDSTWPQRSPGNTMTRCERPSPRWSEESWPTGRR